MPRALGTFCAAGWRNMRPWPVDYRAEPEFELGWDLAGGLESLNLALKEWIGLLAYRLVGHIGAMAPNGC
ncbi:MAG: hypothetical protein Q27BPR15_15310 [Rhodobacter sp. CACIA14H1]|nr:MAG: hypothetical protein Q27BPR15_15310 [Rhodobacter sp. CACIA14H1]